MTPKEKAEELVGKMLMPDNIYQGIKLAKQCALIAVDEILSMGIFSSSGDWEIAKPYWQEVKNHIQEL